MNSFEKVSDALADFGAEQNRINGSHEGQSIAVSNRGRILSEVPFEPGKHDPAHINPLSPMGIVLGTPHVTKRKPDYPLIMSVVIHQEKTDDHSGILLAKRQLGRALMQGLDEARPAHADRVFSYVVGDGEFDDDFDEHIPTKDPESAAHYIADITKEGLTFVISDFANLVLGGLAKANFPATVAVKANHPFELALPANSGKWTTNGKPVNTGKPKELDAYNQGLAAQHQARIAALEARGIAVAPVTFDFTSALGFQEAAVDAAIAQAIQRVTPQ